MVYNLGILTGGFHFAILVVKRIKKFVMKGFPKQVVSFLGFYFFVLLIQLLVANGLQEHLLTNRFFWVGQLLLFVLTFGLLGLVQFALSWDRDKLGFAFLVGSTVKMIVSLFYLVMLIYGASEGFRAVVFYFMATYFVLLVFEVVLVLRQLKNV
jgi:hypothetical protein